MNAEQFFHRCKKDLKQRKKDLFQPVLRIPYFEHVSYREVLRKTETKKMKLRIRKRDIKFIEQIMRKEDQENLMLTGDTEVFKRLCI